MTPTATPTLIRGVADLVISETTLVSTAVVAYQPVDVQFTIRNPGEVNVNNQFFVDLFLLSTAVYSDDTPIEFSSGYIAVGSLAEGASRTITIHAYAGVTADNGPEVFIYGLVDSLQTVTEGAENNNL